MTVTQLYAPVNGPGNSPEKEKTPSANVANDARVAADGFDLGRFFEPQLAESPPAETQSSGLQPAESPSFSDETVSHVAAERGLQPAKSSFSDEQPTLVTTAETTDPEAILAAIRQRFGSANSPVATVNSSPDNNSNAFDAQPTIPDTNTAPFSPKLTATNQSTAPHPSTPTVPFAHQSDNWGALLTDKNRKRAS